MYHKHKPFIFMKNRLWSFNFTLVLFSMRACILPRAVYEQVSMAVEGFNLRSENIVCSYRRIYSQFVEKSSASKEWVYHELWIYLIKDEGEIFCTILNRGWLSWFPLSQFGPICNLPLLRYIFAHFVLSKYLKDLVPAMPVLNGASYRRIHY